MVNMSNFSRTVTINGNHVTLGGAEVKIGEKAPDFYVLSRIFLR